MHNTYPLTCTFEEKKYEEIIDKGTKKQDIEAVRQLLLKKYPKEEDIRMFTEYYTYFHMRGVAQFTEKSGGIKFVATREDEKWKLLHYEYKSIPCQIFSKYNFPDTFKKDCIK
ncbi:Uncharacterised protein [Candidatus Venteria ishoeyi]|uniref:Uncharacterized protein n=2 Tax=Candidatus Venteria ishoeyi TaxID=1899563 RepID=A0A1H6F4R7_9GAMM|nr:Uncharacterised protein [Candidatus Venteria ishoeyi]